MTEGFVGQATCSVEADVGALCARVAGVLILHGWLEPCSSTTSTLCCSQVLLARGDLITETVLAVDVLLGHSNQALTLRGRLVSLILQNIVDLIGIAGLIVGVRCSLSLRTQLWALAPFGRSLRHRC